MSYTTYGYAVDIDKLKQVYGSRDRELLDKILDFSRDRLEQSDGPMFALNLRKALSDIIDATIDESEEEAAYIYALEILCVYLGRVLDGQGHIGYLDDLCWDLSLPEFATPFELPPVLGFPGTSFLTAGEVEQELERFVDIDTESDDSEVTDARDEFVWWLQQCKDAGVGLVIFCY